MGICKFDGKDVTFTPWSEVLGVKQFPIPGAVQNLFTSKDCPKIGATIEKMKPFPPFTWNNNYDEAWYMISGTLVVESDGENHEYNAGDFGLATKGTYTIRAKAKDESGFESDWGTLTVSMPKDKISINSLYIRLLEKLPLLQKLIQNLGL